MSEPISKVKFVSGLMCDAMSEAIVNVSVSEPPKVKSPSITISPVACIDPVTSNA